MAWLRIQLTHEQQQIVDAKALHRAQSGRKARLEKRLGPEQPEDREGGRICHKGI